MATEPWYRTYFSPDYWLLARVEYSEERTLREVSYLLDVLRRHAPGRRVADLGCGTGRHAIPLAAAGYEVVGIDVSDWAIEEARRRSSALGVASRWVCADLLSAASWPLPTVDAAICIQAFGFGTDADQRRFLRMARELLRSGGVLIVDHSNPFWIASHFEPSATLEVCGTAFELQRSYDLGTGRNQGSMRVRRGDGDSVVPHDYRLYTTTEMVGLVRECGFSVLQIDGDFSQGRPPDLGSRYVQLVCVPRSGPPNDLAVTAYESPPAGLLDLRWAPDESAWLSIDPRQVFVNLIDDEPAAIERARAYAVDDPYGARRGIQSVSKYFGRSLPEDSLTFGAGITSLLRAAAGLADRGLALADRWSHPDLPAWVLAQGGDLRLVDATAPVAALAAAIHTGRPSLVLLDRPGLMGSVMPPAELRAVAAAAESVGAVVIVDEAYGNYLKPEASAVCLVPRCANLVVLRSLSKGYGLGGLRVGFAVASGPPARRLRELVAPLEVSELAYQMAQRLLAAGDVCAPLRERIRMVKPVVVALVQQAGLPVTVGHPDLPWVLLRDPEGSSGRRLSDLGVAAKRIVPPPGADRQHELVRLAVPLAEERFRQFQARLHQ